MGHTYPRLEQVRQSLQIRWYRTRLEPATLKEVTARSNAGGAVQTIGHLLLYIGTGTLAVWMWQIQLWVGFAVAMVLHGIVSSFLRGIATHELAHGTVFRTKWLNKAFLYPFSLLNWWNHVDYAMSHTYHHRYTLHPDGDREVLLPLRPVPGPLALIQLMTVNLFIPTGRTFSSGGLVPTMLRNLRSALGMRVTSHSASSDWIRALHEDNPKEARRSRRWSLLTILFHGAVVATGVATGFWVLPIVISVAPFTANLVLYLVGLPQHCGLRDKETDFRMCARSMRLGPVLEFLYWNMNWHLEHHMYAAVPCYNLKKLSRLIASDLPEPKSLAGAWKEMREIWKLQKQDPAFQFAPQLPPTATAASSVPGGSPPPVTDGDLEQSIGDLPPKGRE